MKCESFMGPGLSIDSKPFMSAVNRQAFDRTAGKYPWQQCPTQNGQTIDHVLAQNLAGYAGWIEERVSRGAKVKELASAANRSVEVEQHHS